MKTVNISKFFLNALTTSAFLLCILAISAVAANAQTFIAGNPTCADLGFTNEFKVDPPKPGTFNLPNGGQVMVIIDANEKISFHTSGVLFQAVIVKGGPNANVYYYNSPVMSGGPLRTPVNPSNNQNYGLSHYNFCYNNTAFVPTAATAMIAGRVTVNTGFIRGNGSVLVTVLNSRTLETQTAFTNRLGYYEFNDLPVGDTYVISARGKGYSFAPQIVSLSEDSPLDLFGTAIERSNSKGLEENF
jgi:hypothetical protein